MIVLRKGLQSVLIILFVCMLTGCMYPEKELTKNKVPYQDQIDTVQKAVNQFKEDNGGILPIKTRDAKTPIYQKYPIDFTRLKPKYLAEAPGNAFENGGIFQYVLVDVETNPTVKLLDVRMAETIRELTFRIKAEDYPPVKEKLENNVFTLDYKKLGYKEDPYVVSPFTNHNLPIVMNGKAELFVDYRMDLNQFLQEKKYEAKPGEDIRGILVENSMFVPAYSLPYTIDEKTKEPIFLTK